MFLRDLTPVPASAICTTCCAAADECPLCDEPGCRAHAVVFGARDGFCLTHRDPCPGCSEPVAKGAGMCPECRLDQIRNEITWHEAMSPAAEQGAA